MAVSSVTLFSTSVQNAQPVRRMFEKPIKGFAAGAALGAALASAEAAVEGAGAAVAAVVAAALGAVVAPALLQADTTIAITLSNTKMDLEPGRTGARRRWSSASSLDPSILLMPLVAH